MYKEKIHIIFSLFAFLLVAVIFQGTSYALPRPIERLYAYCNNNHARNLADGTDAEIVCRNGDPNNILNDPRVSELWDNLTRQQQQTVVDTDHCEQIYSDAGDTVVEDCRDLVNPHTGVVRDPIVVGRGGDGSTIPGADPLASEDIFGTSREELQTCDGAECVNNNPITKMVIYAINILSALAGVIAVAMIVLAGIQYSSSGGNPQVTAEAKKRIINVVIALAAWSFLWAFLQWVIPGGALNG